DIECTNQPNFCRVDIELKELSGVVTSPNFPNNYDAGETCEWTIKAPPGYRVQFAIHFLGIEDHRYSRPGSCGDDSVKISEHRNNFTRDVDLLCGCKRLFSFVSYEREMFLRFDSFRKHNWPGFYATYQALSPRECPAGETNCPRKKTAPIGFNAQGQVCRAPPSPEELVSKDGGNITLDSEAKIQIVCRPDYIELTLQKLDFPGLIVNDSVLHLEDEACVASYKDDSMVKFTFGLEACNTEQEDDGEKIYYKNKVYLKAGQPSEDDAITRVHTEVIPFKCGYEKKATISKVSYNPRTTQVVTDADGFGNFTYFMDMYENDSNNETVTEFPKEVGLGQRMYFGFRVESGDSELVVFPDVCKATASSSFDSTPDHLIIKNACSRDNTLEYRYHQNSKHLFNIAGFRFKEGYDDVYIHCKLTVCRKGDSESRCVRGCEASKRRRRSTEEDMSAEVYIGPLKPKVTTNEAADGHDYESETPSSMVLIVAVLVGVLGTVAIGLIIALIIFSRRRNSSGRGVSLIVADKM
ncbi:ZP domain-containing protein-like, partial [Oculina patagonica]